MSKIKVIIPNAGMSSSTLKERERMLKAVAREDTEISVDCIKGGPESLESEYDSLMASRYILEEVKIAEISGFDAIIIYCGGDPALGAAREIVNIPVIGPGEVSIHLASMLSRRFTIISGSEEKFAKSKLNYICLASIRSLNIPVIDLRDSKGVVREAKEAVIREGRKAIEEDGAQAIVLGCLGLAGIGKEVQEELGVPVIDPAFVSINMAELLIFSNLTHSKLAYPNPPKKKYYEI
ncbi:MAG TPA: aspartate/glutamate racemase family protein [Atribacterota bacterium]|nr:aspartate/glutamate racemase family protein [Atribacterota bacterium]